MEFSLSDQEPAFAGEARRRLEAERPRERRATTSGPACAVEIGLRSGA
jgi:hypothetical protein